MKRSVIGVLLKAAKSKLAIPAARKLGSVRLSLPKANAGGAAKHAVLGLTKAVVRFLLRGHRQRRLDQQGVRLRLAGRRRHDELGLRLLELLGQRHLDPDLGVALGEVLAQEGNLDEAGGLCAGLRKGGHPLPADYLGAVIEELRQRQRTPRPDQGEITRLRRELERWQRLFVLEEVDEVVLERELVERREVPEVEARRPEREGHEGMGEDAERPHPGEGQRRAEDGPAPASTPRTCNG